ncbi:MAG: UPF0147 family protein [Candidatus Micrarchaeia archaeon]
MNDVKKDIEKISESIDMLLEDTSIPKNVRNVIQRAKDRLSDTSDINTAISGAIYALDEISNDINMPMHARTMIWNLLSELEALEIH